MHVAIVSVDVGNVIVRPQGEPRQTLEVDFVANKGGQRYYVQSAYQMLSDEKMIQEKRSLLHINDSFKKILPRLGGCSVVRCGVVVAADLQSAAIEYRNSQS